MNAFRRKELARAIEMIEQAQDIISCVLEDEQEAYDNLPENLNNTERACQMDENIMNLGDLDNDIEDLKENIQEIIDA